MSFEGVTSALGEELSRFSGVRSTRVAAQPSLGAITVTGTGSVDAAGTTFTVASTTGMSAGQTLRVRGSWLRASGSPGEGFGASRDATFPHILAFGSGDRIRVPKQGFAHITEVTAGVTYRLEATRDLFSVSDVGRTITVYGASTGNRGTFSISAYQSTRAVDIANAGGSAETGPFYVLMEGVEPGDTFTSRTQTTGLVVATLDESGIAAELVDPALSFSNESWEIRGLFREAIIEAVSPTTLTLAGLGLGANAGLTGLAYQVITQADTDLTVEGTLGWADVGTVFISGTEHRYAGRTQTELRGLLHWDGTEWLPGVSSAYEPRTEVVDANRDYSFLDKGRDAYLTQKAVGAALTAIGAKLGVPRPGGLSDDEVYRRLIENLAYAPRGTLYSLEIALETVLGSNYNIFEDFASGKHDATVFFERLNLDPTQFEGKAFVGSRVELARLATTTTITGLDDSPPTTPLITSVQLADEPASPVPMGTKFHEQDRHLVQFIDAGQMSTTARVSGNLRITRVLGQSWNCMVGDQLEILDGPWRGTVATVRAVLDGTGTGDIIELVGDPVLGIPLQPWPDETVARGGPGTAEYKPGFTAVRFFSALPPALAIGDRLVWRDAEGNDLGSVAVVGAGLPIPPGLFLTSANNLGFDPLAIYGWELRRATEPDLLGSRAKVTRAASYFHVADPEDELVVEELNQPGVPQWELVVANSGQSGISGDHRVIEGPLAADTAYYRHFLRATPEGEIYVSIQAAFSGTPDAGATSGDQQGWRINNGDRSVRVGIIDTDVGFVDGTGAHIGTPTGVTLNTYDLWEVKIDGRAGEAELWQNGALAETATLTDFATATNTAFDIGVFNAEDDKELRVRAVGWSTKNTTEFGNRVDTTRVDTTNPATVLTTLPVFDTTEKSVSISDSLFGGASTDSSSDGDWVVSGVVNATEAIVRGRTRYNAEFSDDQLTVQDGTKPFIWPDHLGHRLEVLTGDNVGIYEIEAILDEAGEEIAADIPVTRDLILAGNFQTSRLPVRVRAETVVLDTAEPVSGGAGLTDNGLFRTAERATWRLVPRFPATTGNAGGFISVEGEVTYSGGTVTLPQTTTSIAPGITDQSFAGGTWEPLMKVTRSSVDSGYLVPDENTNEFLDPGYSYYPFYLWDPWSYVRGVIKGLTAAGVFEDFDRLSTRDGYPAILE